MVPTDDIAAKPVPGAASSSDARVAWSWLTVIAIAFLALRAPAMYRQPGGQDEDYYAVPGWTILRTGIPQLPHVPARNPESVFFHADEALYSEPPLYFYFQAVFYSVLPDVYGTARLSSAVAGLVLMGLVYAVSRAVGLGLSASLSAAGLLSLSRWFYFPATTARPDILCGAFGLAAILCVIDWRRTDRVTRLILAGVCIGLGGLTHPFAIVYAIQIGAWVVTASRGWGRIRHAALLTAAALLVFSLWAPLILLHPDVFQVQFRNQFSGGEGQPIWSRFIFPFPSLAFHLQRMWEHVGAIQFMLLAVGLIGGTLLSRRGRDAGVWSVCLLAWSAIFLISVAVGPHHSVLGYWVYPAGLMFVCLAMLLERTARRAGPKPIEGTSTRRRQFMLATVALGLLSLMVPGSGLRALLAHLRHWNDIHYDAPRFAGKLIDSLPPDDVYAVDREFALDFLVAGRRVLIAQTLPHYFQVDQFHYDYLVIGRHDGRNALTRQPEAELIRAEGIEADEFACYAEIYRVNH